MKKLLSGSQESSLQHKRGGKVRLRLRITAIMLLTACGGGPAAGPAATLPPAATATSAPAATATSMPTQAATATPTPRLPVSLGTQMPAPGLALSADNVDQVVELARWGKGVITDVVYSPDGKLIAVGSTLGVSLYQADTLEEKIYFDTGASVNSLAFSPDGQTIATGLKENTLKLWKASDGALIKSLDGHHEEAKSKTAAKTEVTSVSFSPDGSQLAGGSTDGTVSLWQVSDGSLVNTLKNHTLRVSRVFFSPDGQALFSASWDGKVRMVDAASGKPIQTFGGTYIIDAVISTDGKTLATYDHRIYRTQGNVVLWDVTTGKKLKSIAGGDSYSGTDITSIALSPDGQLVAAAWRDHTAKTWSVTSGIIQNTLEDLQPKNGGWYYYVDFTLAFSPDGQSLLMAGSDTLGKWDIKKGTLLTSVKIKSEGMYDVALSPDGQTLASVEGPNIILRQFPKGSALPSQDLMQSNRSIDFSPDGATLLACMFDSTARLWPLSDQGVKKSFETDRKEYLDTVAFSPDGQSLAMETSYTGRVELRKVSDASLIKAMQIGSFYGYRTGTLAFSSDGKYLAAALDSHIRVFQVPDGKALKSLVGGFSIAFSPDGTLLAGGAEDKTIRVWKMPKGELLLTIKDRPDSVGAVRFSPDGKLLASGSADGTIEIFLVSDGTMLKSWNAHSQSINDLLFTADGKWLISASDDGTIRIWGLKP